MSVFTEYLLVLAGTSSVHQEISSKPEILPRERSLTTLLIFSIFTISFCYLCPPCPVAGGWIFIPSPLKVDYANNTTVAQLRKELTASFL